jgi:hypothetical protein
MYLIVRFVQNCSHFEFSKFRSKAQRCLIIFFVCCVLAQLTEVARDWRIIFCMFSLIGCYCSVGDDVKSVLEGNFRQLSGDRTYDVSCTLYKGVLGVVCNIM